MTTPPDPRDAPVLGGSGGGMRLELALSGSTNAEEDPFVPLNDSGRLSRILLGRIALGRDATVRPVAVKIQKSAYRKGATTLGQDTLSGRRVDELWNRERDFLDRCGGGNVLSRLDVGDAGFHSRPITYCRKTAAYFHPPCPSCGGPLGDCRDDALLRDLGLPEFLSSSTRYLACASCLKTAGEEKTFYSFSPTPEERPRGKVKIRRRGELYRDLLPLVAAPPEKEQARLRRVFPCLECSHRAACYPAGSDDSKPIPAESELTPVSYYEAYLLVLDPVELHFDEACDWLGGATWKEMRARASRTGGPGRELLLADLDAPVEASPEWLFGSGASGRLPLEALRLKLGLFGQVLRAVATYHDKCGQPHLDLSPSKVMVDIVPPVPGIPARWGCQVRLVGLGGAPRLHSTSGAASELLVPPPNADKMFLAPMVRQMSSGREEPMRISLGEAKTESGAKTVEGSATSSRIRMDEFGARDIARIVPASGSGALENRTIWATLQAKEERGFTFTAILPEGVDPARKPGEFDATVSIYKRYHVPCDLYGLGLLLFRALLVNDARDMFAVDDAVQRVLQKFSVSLQTGSDPGRKIGVRLLRLLEEEGDIFKAPGVLYRAGDRTAGVSRVPPRLWSDLLLFGFRLATMTPGFSFCADHTDYLADRPVEVLQRVMADYAELDARAHVELLGKADRDQAIHEACAELMAELGTATEPVGLEQSGE